MTKIKEALLKRFEKHRIVFWYDEKADFREHYDEISLDGVEKIHVIGNECAV